MKGRELKATPLAHERGFDNAGAAPWSRSLLSGLKFTARNASVYRLIRDTNATICFEHGRRPEERLPVFQREKGRERLSIDKRSHPFSVRRKAFEAQSLREKALRNIGGRRRQVIAGA